MSSEEFLSIAIDGPSGSGKSSLAKNLAVKLGFIYLDTGALYRAVGLYIYNNAIESRDEKNILASLGDIKIDIIYDDGEQKIYLNNEDVSFKIRKNHISKYASDVSKIPGVRNFLLNLQREKAKFNNIVMDGRDIGTVILPNASLKIFLTASAEERAQRRYKELVQKSRDDGTNINYEYEQILREINERDEQDSNRAVAPLKIASDAVVIDNSEFALSETLNAALNIIRERFTDVCIQ